MGHVQMINYNNPSWLYLILNFHESVRYKTEVPPWYIETEWQAILTTVNQVLKKILWILLPLDTHA